MTQYAWYALIVYVVGLLVWVFLWGSSWHTARDWSDVAQCRVAARMLLMAPIWPLIGLLMVGITVVELWSDADWGRKDG